MRKEGSERKEESERSGSRKREGGVKKKEKTRFGDDGRAKRKKRFVAWCFCFSRVSPFLLVAESTLPCSQLWIEKGELKP
jgi:hypothetical protein